MRRELAFVAKLPNGAELHRKITRNLDWYGANPEWFSDEQRRVRREQGGIESLRYVGAPEWLVRMTPSIMAVIARLRRLVQSLR
jgi:hypothetical protein